MNEREIFAEPKAPDVRCSERRLFASAVAAGTSVTRAADAMPPARHLGYALTWYGLALVLLAIYFAYHISVGRLAFARPRPRED